MRLQVKNVIHDFEEDREQRDIFGSDDTSKKILMKEMMREANQYCRRRRGYE